MKIAIAGPGRSGTSLLVKLFGGWGFSAPDSINWFQDAEAGLESRISENNNLEIQKDPFLSNYIHELPKDFVNNLSAVIIPMRDINEASLSREFQERLFKAKNLAGNQWKWDVWGVYPAGAVYSVEAPEIAGVLAKELWKLLVELEKFDVPVIMLNFPRFATDFEYTWKKLGAHIESRISKEAAEKVFAQIVDPTKIRISDPNSNYNPHIKELELIIDNLQAEIQSLKAKQQEQN